MSGQSSSSADAAASTPVLHVSWDDSEGPDPQNPRNWSAGKKWLHIMTVSVMAFLVPVVSSALAPAVPTIMIELNTSSSLFATFVVSVFVLGFSCGSAVLAPLSEIHGRMIVYNTSNSLFVLFTALCGVARTEATLLALRFLSGFFGVACVTIASGTIADLMPREERGSAIAIWSCGTIMGPVIGPIVGGWISSVWGWRWTFWALAFVISLVTIFTMVALRETYPVIILERKVKTLRALSDEHNYQSEFNRENSWANLRQSIFRPVKFLFCEPIVTVMCLYVSVLYGILYLLFATYAFLFTQVYGFSMFENGLTFIAGGVGTLGGLVWVGSLSDRNLKRKLAVGQQVTPEDRLPWIITVPGALSFPCGLFIYGWTAQADIHWIVPQIGTAITGFGSIVIFSSIQTYLVDTFELYAASVVGANAILRGLAGALLPLCGLRMYDAIGFGWGNSVLGFMALVLAPVPWVFHVYGAQLRRLRLREKLPSVTR